MVLKKIINGVRLEGEKISPFVETKFAGKSDEM